VFWIGFKLKFKCHGCLLYQDTEKTFLFQNTSTLANSLIPDGATATVKNTNMDTIRAEVERHEALPPLVLTIKDLGGSNEEITATVAAGTGSGRRCSIISSAASLGCIELVLWPLQDPWEPEIVSQCIDSLPRAWDR